MVGPRHHFTPPVLINWISLVSREQTQEKHLTSQKSWQVRRAMRLILTDEMEIEVCLKNKPYFFYMLKRKNWSSLCGAVG